MRENETARQRKDRLGTRQQKRVSGDRKEVVKNRTEQRNEKETLHAHTTFYNCSC